MVRGDQKVILSMMVGMLGIDVRMSSLLRSKTVKKRTIIVGLKSDNCGREMLLRLLTSIVKPGDSVLAVHVQVSNDTFDPNTFHIHEDLCKSKQVRYSHVYVDWEKEPIYWLLILKAFSCRWICRLRFALETRTFLSWPVKYE
jgi:hypothetical protein